jgi:predicted dehydrogenase
MVGLVGCGRWGRLILRDLRQLGCAVAVATPGEASSATASAAGAVAVVRDVDDLPEVDGVIVAVPTCLHAEVTTRALQRGVPVFVEKPLTADVVSAEELVAAGSGRLFVMDKWRYHPGVHRMAELGSSGTLGTIRGLRTIRVQWGSPHRDVDCAWILAPHDLSIALDLLGAVPTTESAVAHVEHARLTGLLGILRLDGGLWHHLEVGIRSPVTERRIELHGDEGVAILAGGWEDRIIVQRTVTAPSPDIEVHPFDGDLPLLAEIEMFVKHLEGGPPPMSSAEEGLAVVREVARLRTFAGMPE